MEETTATKIGFWHWIGAVCLVSLSVGCAVKIALSQVSITIDFATLLSVILALFSVALSVLFYFKATETSNAFYDNTYKYTKDIAELLVKIEASFGEKLRNLDQGYTSVKSWLENQPHYNRDTPPDIKDKLEQEKAELQKVLDERNKIVEQLIENSQLEAEAKQQITKDLELKNQELEDLNRHVGKLRVELHKSRNEPSSRHTPRGSGRVDRYTGKNVISVLTPDFIQNSTAREIMRAFDQIIDSLHEDYLSDMESMGYFHAGSLTPSGVRYIAELSALGKDS